MTELEVAATEVEVSDRTALYRLYDCDGTLMYVGITSNPERRFSQHASDKPWWPNVTRKAVEWYSTRSAAELAEEAAIRLRHPLYNVVHGLPPITVTVEIPGQSVTGLELLHRQMMGPPRDFTFADVLTTLLDRELSARGLLGDPHCWHSWTSWPDGVTVREPNCPCGYPITPDGRHPTQTERFG